MNPAHADGAVHFVELALQGPLDVLATVERFRRWGDDLLDRWDGTTFVRVAFDHGGALPYAGTVIGTIQAPRVRITMNAARDTSVLEPAVRGMWGSCAPRALESLAKRDPVLALLLKRYPGIRPIMHLDGFTALVRSISAQQVNLAWAATTRRRLAQRFGQKLTIGAHEVYVVVPSRLAAANVEALRQLQFTTRKAEYLIGLARAITEGSLDLAEMTACDDEEVIARLCAVRGLGRWTAEWYLARTLGRPVVVAGDLGVRQTVGMVYGAGDMPDERTVRALTAHWGAAAGVAQELLLHARAVDSAWLRRVVALPAAGAE